MNWNDFNFKQKQYFFNNEILFLNKKAKLIETSDITNKMRALHEKLKLLKSDTDREPVARELLSLDDKRAELFLLIDNFDNK